MSSLSAYITAEIYAAGAVGMIGFLIWGERNWRHEFGESQPPLLWLIPIAWAVVFGGAATALFIAGGHI